MTDQSSPQFTEDAAAEAIWNSEWEGLSSAQRACLVDMVGAAREDGTVSRIDVDFSARIAGSKRLSPYIFFQAPHWHITPDARALVQHAQRHFLFPQWRYFRQWDAKRGVAISIVQTQDSAFADQLLAQPGWTEINEHYFKRMALYLARSMMGLRKERVKVEY